MKRNFLIILIVFALSCKLAVASDSERWFVDISTHATMEEATAALTKLSSLEGVKILPQGEKYGISLGPFPTEAAAQAKREQIHGQFPGARLRRGDDNPSLAAENEALSIYEAAIAKRTKGDYQAALNELRKALEITRSPRLITRIHYEMAHNYLALGQKEVAYDTYRKALEQMPELGVTPPPVMAEVAYMAYKRKDFRQAIKIYSLYGSLYPTSRAQADYFIACSFMELKDYRRAMFLFDKIIRDYPSTPFAQESIIALGNIGLLRPKVKAPLALSHFDYVWYPITAYDEVLKGALPDEKRKELMISKAYAYMMIGRPEMAHHMMVHCLRNFAGDPRSIICRNAIARNLPAAIHAYAEQKDEWGVVGIFFQTQALHIPFPSDIASITAIARSLHSIGLSDEAAAFLKASRVKVEANNVIDVDRLLLEIARLPEGQVKKSCDEMAKECEALKEKGTEPPLSLLMSLGDCKFQAREYEAAIPHYTVVAERATDPKERNWARLRLGQAYYRIGKKRKPKKGWMH